MRTLLAGTNVDPADGVYLKGRVRDKVGVTPGTRYNEVLHGDWLQAIHKLVSQAGITENGLPDNESNGFQIIDALVNKMSRNGVKRNNNSTLADGNIGTIEGNIISFTPFGSTSFENINIFFDCRQRHTSSGAHTVTYKIFVGGVVKRTFTVAGLDDDKDRPFNIHLSGISYVAGDAVAITGVTSAFTDEVDLPFLTVEGINN